MHSTWPRRADRPAVRTASPIARAKATTEWRADLLSHAMFSAFDLSDANLFQVLRIGRRLRNKRRDQLDLGLGLGAARGRARRWNSGVVTGSGRQVMMRGSSSRMRSWTNSVAAAAITMDSRAALLVCGITWPLSTAENTGSAARKSAGPWKARRRINGGADPEDRLSAPRRKQPACRTSLPTRPAR
jgi:hypothetical protein